MCSQKKMRMGVRRSVVTAPKFQCNKQQHVEAITMDLEDQKLETLTWLIERLERKLDEFPLGMNASEFGKRIGMRVRHSQLRLQRNSLNGASGKQSMTSEMEVFSSPMSLDNNAYQLNSPSAGRITKCSTCENREAKGLSCADWVWTSDHEMHGCPGPSVQFHVPGDGIRRPWSDQSSDDSRGPGKGNFVHQFQGPTLQDSGRVNPGAEVPPPSFHEMKEETVAFEPSEDKLVGTERNNIRIEGQKHEERVSKQEMERKKKVELFTPLHESRIHSMVASSFIGMGSGC